MRFFYLILLGLLFLNSVFSQTTARAVEKLELATQPDGTQLAAGELPLPPALPFFSYFVKWSDASAEQTYIRFSTDDENWGDWILLQQDTHNEKDFISELHFGDADFCCYQLLVAGQPSDDLQVELHCYNPGQTPPKSTTSAVGAEKSCPCPLPAIEGRSDWCPNGDCPEHPSPSPTTVTHMIVHHAAGTNTASDWAAVVRGIWDFHVNGNGWSDVGYNYLVDPNGVLYEGRGNDVTGAHFCGTNTNTMGVCMLGNYTSITPTDEAIGALQSLLAWKSCDIDADPLGQSFHGASGSNLMHISGHRDGCSTSCPGDAFYPMLPGVRQGVADYIANQCAGLATPLNLSATEVTPTSYFITWTHNSPDEDGFQLERSEDNGDNYSIRANLPANTLSFVEDDLETERIYLYRIRAFTADDYSPYSNILTINTGVVNTSSPTLPTSALKISPHPINDIARLELSGPWRGKLTWQLLDLQQRIVQTGTDRKAGDTWQQTLDLQGLASGTYLLQMRIADEWGTWQLIKG